MKNFYIRTFGCQMNKNDTSIITEILKRSDYQPVHDPCLADIYIINTCSVREHAEQRALGHISSLKNWHKRPGRIIGVVGCMARRLADDIVKDFEFVDLILGPDAYRNIAVYIEQLIKNRARIVDIDPSCETYSDIYPVRSGVTDFVSIMRGCNNFCSYCIVPYLRGAPRSRPLHEIIKEIGDLVDLGVKEVTLLGQNVNEYQYQGIDFADLLMRVAETADLPRLRFLTSHPKDLSRKIILAVKKKSNICEWFHLPVQSGNNRILNMMNRKYAKETYLSLIREIRSHIPGAGITTDIIVGFPTETDAEFEETLDLVKQCQFDDAYMYAYSVRPGTKASNYDPLPESVVKQRLARLIKVQHQIILEKTRKMIGNTYEILIECPARDNAVRGKTSANKDIVVEKAIKPGSICRVKVNEVRGRTPVAKLSSQAISLK